MLSPWTPGGRVVPADIGRHRSITPAERTAIKRAVEFAGRWLPEHERDDIRQELAIKLVTASEPIENVSAWARACAPLMVAGLKREEARRRDIETQHAAGAGRYRTGPNWTPNWYPPHATACEFAPFACAGARMMHRKKQNGSTDAE